MKYFLFGTHMMTLVWMCGFEAFNHVDWGWILGFLWTPNGRSFLGPIGLVSGVSVSCLPNIILSLCFWSAFWAQLLQFFVHQVSMLQGALRHEHTHSYLFIITSLFNLLMQWYILRQHKAPIVSHDLVACAQQSTMRVTMLSKNHSQYIS